MSNFDFLTKQFLFKSFASAAVNAEKCLSIDPSLAITQCRRALELAINWMYNVDDELLKPESADLCGLMNNFRFRKIIGESLSTNLNLIRKAGNQAAHGLSFLTGLIRITVMIKHRILSVERMLSMQVILRKQSQKNSSFPMKKKFKLLQSRI